MSKEKHCGHIGPGPHLEVLFCEGVDNVSILFINKSVSPSQISPDLESHSILKGCQLGPLPILFAFLS